jgi:hypothetical protein
MYIKELRPRGFRAAALPGREEHVDAFDIAGEKHACKAPLANRVAARPRRFG